MADNNINKEDRKITFKDLSGSLKTAIVIIWILFGLTVASWLLYIFMFLAMSLGGFGGYGGIV